MTTGNRSPGPAAEATLTVKLSGALATIDALGELTAAMDELLAARYPEVYRGVGLTITADPADLARNEGLPMGGPS